MKKLFYLFILVMTAARLCAIEGDLNNDGRIDIADLVILGEMLGNTLDKTDAADLNFDGKLDNTDKNLLIDAIIYGKPLPKLLKSINMNVYQNSYSLSAGGLTMDIPTSCMGDVTVSFVTMTPPPDFDIDLGPCQMTQPVTVYGMVGAPMLHEGSFTLDVPAEHNDAAGKPMLLLGIPDHGPHRKTTQWSYQLLPAEDEFCVTYANRKLTWTPEFGNNSDYEQKPFSLAVIYKTTATRTEPLQQSTRADDNFAFEKLNYLSWYGIYRTDHFLIELHTSVPETQVRQLAKDLEDAYTKIGEQGMPRLPDFAKKWTNAKRIKVNINKNPIEWYGVIPIGRENATDAYCNAPGLFSAPYIDVPEGCLNYRERAETCCHELFHYHQYYYASHFTAIFLDEMAGSTAEYFITKDKTTYHPDNHTFARAPINGLYRSSSVWNQNGSNHHGYNLTPFGTWLTFVKYKDMEFWPAVFSSQGYKKGDGMWALKLAVKTMNPDDSLAADYLEFIYDYFSLKQGIGYENRNLYTFFIDSTPFVQEPKIDRFKQNGFRAIFSSPADMSKAENTKHTFSIQNYGAATMLVEFGRNSLFLKYYPYALITFSVPDSSRKTITDFKLFAVIGNEKEITVTKPEEVVFDTETNTARLIVPLEDLPRPWTNISHGPYIGLVAAYANDSEDATNTTPIEMRVDFPGPIIANGLVAWRGDYLGQQESRATADLAVTPVNDTVFVGIKDDSLEFGGGNTLRIPGVSAHLGGTTKPKDIMLNITGVIRDATASIAEPSTLYTAEFLGKVQLEITKTTKDNNVVNVPFEKYLLDKLDVAHLTDYTPLAGNSVSISEFLPVATGKNSKFYLRIPNIDYDAALYNIRLNLPYRMYEKDDNNSMDVRDVYIFNLVIYPR